MYIVYLVVGIICRVLFYLSLCKDYHLYKRIHLYKETLPVNKVMMILKQIAQVSISYLVVNFARIEI